MNFAAILLLMISWLKDLPGNLMAIPEKINGTQSEKTGLGTQTVIGISTPRQ